MHVRYWSPHHADIVALCSGIPQRVTCVCTSRPFHFVAHKHAHELPPEAAHVFVSHTHAACFEHRKGKRGHDYGARLEDEEEEEEEES